MDMHKETISELRQRLESLSRKQDAFSAEIAELQTALDRLIRAEEAAQSKPAEQEPGKPAEQQPEKPSEQEPGKPAEQEQAAPVSDSPAPVAVAIRKFQRSGSNKLIAGVCGGVGEYLGISVALVRVLFVFFTVMSCIGAIAYIVLWLIMPRPSAALPVTPPVEAPPVPERVQATPAEPSGARDSGLEKYIGENLIGKIGIVILVIGVSLGVKYSIDNNLISPLVRIVLGYLLGLGLLVLGWRLRPRFANFSATLVSGAMAILYFMTFAAYTFYALFPEWAAFLLMVLITISTVMIALSYNHQIIAVIGQVGAYSIPFLLDEGWGQPAVLLGYIAIINLGILYTAFRRYWIPLYLLTFGMTWLIFFTWYATGFDNDLQRPLCWGFLVLFTLIFYAAFLAYKLLRREAFKPWDVVLLLCNGFIFYGLGYNLLEEGPGGPSYLGAFTFLNAVLHGVIAWGVYLRRGADRSIFHLIMALALVFLTITIPVELDGSWVTLLWMAEAAALFHIGRVRQIGMYENLSYPLMFAGFMSLLQDWSVSAAAASGYGPDSLTPFFNPVFLTALLATAALGYINFLFYKKEGGVVWMEESIATTLLPVGVTGLLLLTLFGSFAVEISNYWDQRLASFLTQHAAWDFELQNLAARDAHSFKGVWLLNYSLLFLSALGAVNTRWIRNRNLGTVSLFLNAMAWFIFLTVGLFLISELRQIWLERGPDEYPGSYGWHIGIRYLSLGLLALLLFVSYSSLQKPFLNLKSPILTDSLLALTVCWLGTSELLHWLTFFEVSDTYKLWLSIFWGTYALGLVGYGLRRRKRHLRMGAIALFSVTLLKLFFYDLAHLSTLSKTIIFISLGAILLLVSYLYQRSRAALSDDDPE